MTVTSKGRRPVARKEADVLRASLKNAGQVQRADRLPLQPGVTHTTTDTGQGEVLVRRRFSALKEGLPAK